MGNNGNKQDRVIPPTGFRVVSMNNSSAAFQLNLLTDYIISPDPRKIDLKRQTVRFEVYSILSQEVRTVELPIINQQLGLQLKIDEINCCIFRITKIFPGSPLEKHKVCVNQFIVGMLEGNYSCVKTFAQMITSKSILAPRSCISLGICDTNGKTRIIRISVEDLKNWQVKGKGLLGCELAEGWIHKWKPSKKQNGLSLATANKQTENEEIKVQQQMEIPQMKAIQNQEEAQSGSSDEVDRKCDSLQGYINGGSEVEVKFKGILRNEEMVDASVLCKCRPIDKECQKCFSQKDGNYYFFNKKTRSIVMTPMKMMLTAE